MRFVKSTPEGAQFHLQAGELQLLHSLLKKFPFTADNPAEISRADTTPEAVEREKLLNESLADHRRELKKSAAQLLAQEKLRPYRKGLLWTLSDGDREIFLQILNDIRVGSWYALGRPVELEVEKNTLLSPQEFAWRSLMHLAGHFQYLMVLPDDPNAEEDDDEE